MHNSRLKTKQMLFALVMAGIILVGAGHSFAEQQSESRFWLVSMGVGDADLITLRAVNTIKASDVIVCRDRTKEELAEYLKGKEILDESLSDWRNYKKECASTEDPEKKAACEKGMESRAKLIGQIRSAIQAGKTVSVLGSGDLMIYGGPYRWYLEEFKDLNPKIVPGVSCFNAANAALGKDIMSGKESHSAVLTTYREIEKFSKNHPSMIIFTMHTRFDELVKKLMENYPPETPIAIVFYAGYKDKEFIVRGRLDTILKETQGQDFPFEHLVYVGDFMK
ncbi:MAG: SAM-dependent methyltransferase [Desulfobacterales bacterium]